MLTVESIDVSIRSIRILRGASLRVERGQLAGLVGRNGAGKTTLLRTVAGSLAPSSGSVALEGRPLGSLPAHARARLGLGWMPEDRRVIPQLTVEENVMVPAWATRAAGAGQRLERIYGMIPELKAIRARKGLQLSGGQQKLVALARALMSGTRLLLLDEPFEGVAPVLARRLSEVIGLLRREGTAVLLAESDLSHARALIDVVFHIDRGTVVGSEALRPAGAPP